jgi:hypothetical protein
MHHVTAPITLGFAGIEGQQVYNPHQYKTLSEKKNDIM